MKGYIVSADYDVKDDRTYVYLFGRLENGDSFAAINEIIPYFFIEETAAHKLKPYLSKYKVEEASLKNFQGKKVIKISHNSQTELNKISSYIHNKDIDSYEADIKPHTRFLIDNDILGTAEIEGDNEKGERTDRIYQNPIIKPSQFTPELKVISIDIESDKNNDKLFCIGIYGKNYKQVFMITDKKLDNVISCKTESECLEKWKNKIIELDPDIITGWNIADFDFPYLKMLFEKHKLDFDIGRTNEQIRMRISADFFRKSVIKVSGRQVIDGLNMIKDPFIKEAPSIKNIDIDSWTLEDVAQALLKEGKLIKGKDRHEIIEKLYKEKTEKSHQALASYNLQDCKLAYDLLEKTKTLELAIERSQLTGLQLDRITASIAAFDSLYIREARKRNLVSPTTHYSSKEERIKGGYVMESKPGIYNNLLVMDFKSLYPSIIKTFNIDPSSYIEKKERNSIESPNGAYFKNQEGILPGIIEKLHQAREKAKREKRELASYAIKIIQNSFFGVLASPNCRYFNLKMANAITHFGQFIIKLTAKKIEEQGYEVIYSDTDSVFLHVEKDNKKAEKIGEELQEYINNFYKKYVKENYNRTSYLELEFKRHYLSFLFPPLRKTERGSKKRYAGLYEKDGKEELEIVGLEAIRGDWTEAAQEFQKELLIHIFKKKEFIKFIKDYVKKIKSGKLDNKLVYTKSIRKGLEKYTKTTPPHVKAARKLDKLESNIIQYYMTTDGPEPIQKLKHKIDYEHYVEKQIKPIANTILFFFKKTFDEIANETKQTKLFS